MVKTFNVKFVGIDDWGRPVFKIEDKKVYFGSTVTLFPNKSIAPNNTDEEISNYFRDNTDELELFGERFNCEPHGGHASNWKFNIL